MASTLPPNGVPATPPSPMDPTRAFVAVALAAVSWDGVLTPAGSRALRHALDYRAPYSQLSDQAMVQLVDSVLADLRAQGPQHLMLEAATALSPRQCHTAYAVATEIMRSDGPLEPDERNILSSLAYAFKLEELETSIVQTAMDVLHASLLEEE
jgi:tellurite resistance protein